MRQASLLAIVAAFAGMLAIPPADVRAGIEFVEVSTEFTIDPSMQNPVPLEEFDPEIAPVALFDQGSSLGAAFFGIGRAYSTPPSAWGFSEGQSGSLLVDRKALVFETTFFSAVSGLDSRGPGDGVATASLRSRSGRVIRAPILVFQDDVLTQVVFRGRKIVLPDLGGTQSRVTLFSFVPIGRLEFQHSAPEDAAEEREPTALTIDSLVIPAIVFTNGL